MATRLPPATAGSPVIVLPYHFASVTADATAAVKIKLPFEADIAGFSVAARASSGTSPTLDINLKAGVSSLLTAPVSVSTSTVTEAAIATKRVADETILTIDFDIGGTSTPTFLDVDILLTLVRI
ncbi:hypothetical protein [Niveispirillum cyanobacteriorum]|uniref:Uncharacterized protein n=1 Tax=Niveispirillum cyanobacteriorum TaxID=1612173 RepID=A0A2K9NE27_9PROT|nr:hypothetical protein [Niveispirillum cyanobacteriorum]AUN31242.1 hypothetical protein C0V82_14120 [Niveispirillum cyanobacteriorum]GGE73009.1 hypothetical protein GCM10011317_32790 [Niveispirillum cyanobacteriorum]